VLLESAPGAVRDQSGGRTLSPDAAVWLDLTGAEQ
jgi:hypothetical protein